MLSASTILDHLDSTTLQRCLRDVVALSTLPALWVDATPSQIATYLADALWSMLRVELVYVRLAGSATEPAFEVGRLADAPSQAAVGRALGETLAPWVADAAHGDPVLVPHPQGSGSLQLLIMPLGTGRASGCIAVGAAHAEFPNDTDRLLLRVAANQASLAVRSAGRFAEQQRAEQELRDFVDNATVSLHWVGPDGTILWANQAELDLLGYTREEYIGRHIAEVHDDRETIDDILQRLASNETLRNVEARMRCKDGSIRWVLIDSSVRWEEGRFLHTRCFTRDITARKQAEARYQVLFEQAADAVLVTDAAGQFLDVNPAALAMLGYEREEFLACQLSELIGPSHAGADEDWAALATADAWRGELELRRADGSVVPVEAQAATVDLPDGRVVLTIMRDIAARRAVERMQQEFLALVTHELKGPLTAVKGFAQLMQRRATYTPQGVAVILDRTEHLERLITDLLDATRLGVGQLSLSRTTTDLVPVVLACAEDAQASTQRHLIVVEPPAGPLVGWWDKDRLGQIVHNLLSNAIKYSPDGGPIRVTLEDRGDAVHVTVTDQGIGVPAAEQPRLFERFYRAEALRLATSGLGLGLYITRMLVEAHGGEVGVHAEPGQGSTFWFALPVGDGVADR